MTKGAHIVFNQEHDFSRGKHLYTMYVFLLMERIWIGRDGLEREGKERN